MLDFAAIDFETANSERWSACSVGLIVVCGGQVAESTEFLIKPVGPNWIAERELKRNSTSFGTTIPSPRANRLRF